MSRLEEEKYNSEHSLYIMLVDMMVGKPRNIHEVLDFPCTKLVYQDLNDTINLLARQFNAIDWELIPEDEELDEMQLIADELSKKEDDLSKRLVRTLNWSISNHRVSRAHKHCHCK